jgi:hypothetical protein
VRLYSRRNDLTYRFALIVEALARLRSRSCIIDGEAVSCEDNGMPSFDCILCSVFLYTFDPGGRQDALRQFLLRLRDPTATMDYDGPPTVNPDSGIGRVIAVALRVITEGIVTGG